MIVTVTAHPSIDRTVELAAPLHRGSVGRARAIYEQAAGKGVNISRVAVAAGVPTLAVVLADATSTFAQDVASDDIPASAIGNLAVRVNLTLTEPDGTTTKVNSSSEEVSTAQLDLLRDEVMRAARGASWVVLTGSLPPGAPTRWYADVAAQLASEAETQGVNVAIDTSDHALRDVVATLGDCRPALLKPNAEELAGVTGEDPGSLEASPDRAAAAARRLVDAGAQAVLATLGPAGAVLVTSQGAWRAAPPTVSVASTVGAGDSSLFGYLRAALEGLAPAPCLASAVAYGAAATTLPGTTLPISDQVHPELVEVTALSGETPSPVGS
ncbi:1-phosphofructokinase family hexose kinase [Janibacter sp. GS2]|uniref:1-phosphofructokinase family hexose kinase n=1 Tax=Janibacter sp. GS2 TaxID=3442646 RepID=UPI003EB98D07